MIHAVPGIVLPRRLYSAAAIALALALWALELEGGPYLEGSPESRGVAPQASGSGVLWAMSHVLVT